MVWKIIKNKKKDRGKDFLGKTKEEEEEVKLDTVLCASLCLLFGINSL